MLRLKHYHHHERSDEIVDFFYRSFFGFLANALQGREGDSLRWLDGVGESTWQYRCLRHLNSVATTGRWHVGSGIDTFAPMVL